MSTEHAPKTLIVYSHDSSEHIDRVVRLADEFADKGIEAYVDRHFPAPAYGWAVWMQWMIRNMDFVLVVCTEHYHRRTRDLGNPFSSGPEPGGKGVPFEFVLICNHIYFNNSRNDRFIPVVFARQDREFIPDVLKAQSGHVVSDLSSCAELLSQLRGAGHDRAARRDIKSDGAAGAEVAFDVLIGFAPEQTTLAEGLGKELYNRNVTCLSYPWDRNGRPPTELARSTVLLVGEEGFGPFDALAASGGPNTNGAAGVQSVNAVWLVPAADRPAPPSGLRLDHEFEHASGTDLGALAEWVHEVSGRPAVGRPTPPPNLLTDIGGNLLERSDNDSFLVYDRRGRPRRLGWTLSAKIPKPGKDTSAEKEAFAWKRLHSAAEIFYRNAFLELRLYAERAIHAPHYSGKEACARQTRDFLREVVPQFQGYAIELDSMPKWFRKTDVYRQLRAIRDCHGVLLQSLSSPPGSRSLENGLCLIEQMSHWLLDALHMADQSLLVYIEDAK